MTRVNSAHAFPNVPQPVETDTEEKKLLNKLVILFCFLHTQSILVTS